MTEIIFQRVYDDINSDGSRVSDAAIRAIAQIYPYAVWEKESDDAWRIVV